MQRCLSTIFTVAMLEESTLLKQCNIVNLCKQIKIYACSCMCQTKHVL